MLEKSPATGLSESHKPLPVPPKSTMAVLRQELAARALPASCRAVGLSRAETVGRVLKHLRETARRFPV